MTQLVIAKMFNKLNLSSTTTATIAWDMTPDLAFCTFSAKGLREELTNTDERVCYFFIDNWGDKPKLYLMERGTRYVNILAQINAPLKMLTNCIINQGSTLSSKNNYSIDSTIKEWIITEVVKPENSRYLIPVTEKEPVVEDFGAVLPMSGQTDSQIEKVRLSRVHCTLDDNQLKQIITQWNFYDSQLNPKGIFYNALKDTGDTLTVIDERTDVLWQRSGLDLCSIRKMTSHIEQLNKNGFAGYNDWRIPTLEEAMSLMESTPNMKGLFLHPCFSKEQPFVFVAAQRKPTGYWFVDYKQGKVYWSSGTVPGGFCRLCRNTY